MSRPLKLAGGVVGAVAASSRVVRSGSPVEKRRSRTEELAKRANGGSHAPIWRLAGTVSQVARVNFGVFRPGKNRRSSNSRVDSSCRRVYRDVRRAYRLVEGVFRGSRQVSMPDWQGRSLGASEDLDAKGEPLLQRSWGRPAGLAARMEVGGSGSAPLLASPLTQPPPAQGGGTRGEEAARRPPPSCPPPIPTHHPAQGGGTRGRDAASNPRGCGFRPEGP